MLTFSGWVGVDLFFVLSGFLVSNLLFQEYTKTGNVKPLRFLARRGLKIYPLYYLMIFVFWQVSVYFDPNYAATHQKHLLVECLFVQNYLPQFMMTNQTWSLAIEEHFYIGLAVLMWERGPQPALRLLRQSRRHHRRAVVVEPHTVDDGRQLRVGGE